MSDRAPDYFLNEGPLTPGDAAVALLVLDDGRYLMQLRDEKPGIFFPGHWGFFGGGVEPGEGVEAALRRELREELGYDAPTMVWFTTMKLDFTALGGGPVERHFFETPLAAAQMERLILGEGRAMRAFEGPDLLARERVTPYDAFALWMHLTRASHERARRSEDLNEEARRLQEFPR